LSVGDSREYFINLIAYTQFESCNETGLFFII